MKIRKTGRKLKRFRLKRSMPFNKQQVKVIKKLSQSKVESKYQDYTDSSNDFTTGSFTQLSALTSWNLTQGDGQGERIGQKISPKSFQVRGYITSSVVATMRVIVVMFDKFNANISTSINTDWNIGVNGFYPRDVEDYTYKVVKDFSFIIDPDTSNRKLLNMNLSKYLKEIDYNSDTATNYHTNKLQIFVYTDNTTSTNITGLFQSRLVYKDS